MSATVTGFIAYAADRGLVVVDEAATAQALVRATDYINYKYVSNFAPQYDASLIVVDLAIYEAAKVELVNPNFFNRTYLPSDVKTLTEVDGIKWTVVSTGASDVSTPVSTLIEMMMKPYLRLDAAAEVRGPRLWSIGS